MKKEPRTKTSDSEKVNAENFENLFKTLSANESHVAPSLFTNRRIFSNMLARIELFKRVLEIPGDVIECGVFKGNGLMTFFHLSSVLEPYNINRKIIGFDTFTGFPNANYEFDPEINEGYLNEVNFNVLLRILELQECDKLLDHVSKSLLIQGNAMDTIPDYVKSTPSLIVSLLYLDFDTYEATRTALENFYPLIPRGGLIAFDELGQSKWPGETKAFKEVLDLDSSKLQKFTFEPNVTYFVKD